MHWIVQNNIFNEEQYDKFIEALKRLDCSYSEHKVIPFIGEIVPGYYESNQNVICIGSYSMRHIANKKGWNPGVFDIYEKDFTVQKERWGKKLLNFSSEVVQFKDVKFKYDEMFLRPTTDSKVFAGKIFDKQFFEKWKNNVCELGLNDGTSLQPDTLVQVCEPIRIFSEYRFWVVKNKIVTASLYKRGSLVTYSSYVEPIFFDFVNSVISEWSPHETFVIDVADTENGIKIVEPNTLNAAGFYAGDLQKLVFALENGYGK